MASNIRAKPIEGHITDSAGNVLRNARIIIKQSTPSGSYSVDTVNSDDSGYFTSKPIPNGIYDIYESGIRISKTIHKPGENSIQCFKAHRDNYNVSNVQGFDYLIENNQLNNFKAFIQIEAAESDVSQYGNYFPIYDFNLFTEDPGLGDDNELWDMSRFFEFNSDSRITTTRFDIEYFSPLTSLSSLYQRIRWSGVPAIRYYQDSKLVVPLDYFSMVLNYPRIITPEVSDFTESSNIVVTKIDDSTITIKNTSNNENFETLSSTVKVGSVLKTAIKESGDPTEYIHYGIITDISSVSNVYTITLEELLSSRYTTTVDVDSSDYYVTRVYGYDGMFRGISDIDEDANEKFSVVENVYAQDLTSEMYNYTNRYTS